MRLTEKQILLDLKTHWVCEDKDSYTVWITGVTHSTMDSAYSKDADGLSIAMARCNYLANKVKA